MRERDDRTSALTVLLSRTACAEVNQAMLELTGVNYNTEEQNKDMTSKQCISLFF